jgi:hypothetical protein
MGGAAGSGGGAVGVGGASGAGGDGSGLPACAISARPADPTNASVDGGIDSNGACNSIALATGPGVNRGCFDPQGSGGLVDGGVVAGPAGGTIRDGDYDLLSADTALTGQACPPNYSSGTTQRRLRVFGGGTYFEWAASNSGGSNTSFWYDTTMSAAGHTLTFASFDCGSSFNVASYGYTASGDDFTYFAYAGMADGTGALQTIVHYRRSCWR